MVLVHGDENSVEYHAELCFPLQLYSVSRRRAKIIQL
jgi:hypothetical protein